MQVPWGWGPGDPEKPLSTSGLLVMPTVSSQCLLLPEQWPTSLWPPDNELFEVQMSPSIFRPLQPWVGKSRVLLRSNALRMTSDDLMVSVFPRACGVGAQREEALSRDHTHCGHRWLQNSVLPACWVP